MRETFAILLGAFTGLALATFWTGGWAIAVVVLLMFVPSRRPPDRRIEIAWFVLGAVAAIVVVLTR